MIVEIDKSVIKSLEHHSCTDVLNFLIELAGLRRRNKIELIAEREVFEKLIKNHSKSLGDLMVGVYKFLNSKMATTYNAIELVCNYIKVISSKYYNAEKEEHVFYIDIEQEKFADSININLLCENLKDCKFYEFMAMYYIKNSRKEQKNISINLLHGGGGTAHQILEHEISKRSYSLCIIDSDIKYDGCAEGNTYSALEKIHNSQKGYSKLLSTGVRELENLVPLESIARDLESADEEYRKSYYMLENLKKTDAWKYFDYKKGIRPENMGTSEKDYWIKILETDNLDTIIGLGGKNMSNFIDNLINSKNYDFKLEEGLGEYWNIIGKTVADWGYVSGVRIT